MMPNDNNSNSQQIAEQVKTLEKQKAKTTDPQLKLAIEKKIDAVKCGKEITK